MMYRPITDKWALPDDIQTNHSELGDLTWHRGNIFKITGMRI